jgi:hypothetical protein
MKGIISIFALPQEIEDLAGTLEKLKRNSVYVTDKFQYKVEVTMCLSDELTDWKEMQLPKSYFEDRANELCAKYLDWCSYECVIEETTKILGCVSQRRESLKNNQDADFFIWLDCDIVFKDTTLYYASSAYEMAKAAGLYNVVVTPQFVKQWDSTWDIIANKKYINYPINYHLNCNIYKEGLPELSELSVTQVNGFKFAGGWFTLISKDLLNRVGVPESFGHYGLEDTFIMACSYMMQQKGEQVSQFVLENLIVGENHLNRANESIKKYIKSIDKKEEFKKIAHSNWETEINLFNKK